MGHNVEWLKNTMSLWKKLKIFQFSSIHINWTFFSLLPFLPIVDVCFRSTFFRVDFFYIHQRFVHVGVFLQPMLFPIYIFYFSLFRSSDVCYILRFSSRRLYVLTFCPSRRFFIFDLLSGPAFFLFDVLSHSAFFPIRRFFLFGFFSFDVFSDDFFTFGVFHFDILSENRV